MANIIIKEERHGVPEEVYDDVEMEDVEEEVMAEAVDDDSEEWEEMTMVVTVNGILDADLVRDAVQRNLVGLRYAETDAPVLQINNSVYTGTWNQDLGTNLVLESKGKDLEVISCTSTMLTAEKALLTAINNDVHSLAADPESAPKASLSRTQVREK